MNTNELIKEIIIYNHVLSSNEIAMVEKYLQKNEELEHKRLNTEVFFFLCIVISLILLMTRRH